MYFKTSFVPIILLLNKKLQNNLFLKFLVLNFHFQNSYQLQKSQSPKHRWLLKFVLFCFVFSFLLINNLNLFLYLVKFIPKPESCLHQSFNLELLVKTRIQVRTKTFKYSTSSKQHHTKDRFHYYKIKINKIDSNRY